MLQSSSHILKPCWVYFESLLPPLLSTVEASSIDGLSSIPSPTQTTNLHSEVMPSLVILMTHRSPRLAHKAIWRNDDVFRSAFLKWRSHQTLNTHHWMDVVDSLLGSPYQPTSLNRLPMVQGFLSLNQRYSSVDQRKTKLLKISYIILSPLYQVI